MSVGRLDNSRNVCGGRCARLVADGLAPTWDWDI